MRLPPESLASALILGLCAAALAGSGDPPPPAAESLVTPERRAHWAYRKPALRAPPKVKNRAWVRNPIDAFVLARLEAARLAPARPASKTALIRRVTFDLTGLPPSPAQVDAFLADGSPEAYERVVDRLLSSPRYGERWARHWLDLVRYADTNGYEHDEVRPDAWRYRDYVVRAFNKDKPFDRFVREQIAGDELPDGGTEGLIATGFALLGPDMTDAADQSVRRQITLNDITDTVGLAFLGMTVGCARCHDHKFEAIPQADYYRLQAFFARAEFRRDLPLAGQEERARYEAELAAHGKILEPGRAAMAAIEAPYREKLVAAKRAALAEDVRTALDTPAAQRTAEQQLLAGSAGRALATKPDEVRRELSDADRRRYAAAQEQLRQLETRRPAPLPIAMGLRGGPAPVATHLLERGEFEARGPAVRAGFPVVLEGGGAGRPVPESRRELAAWLVAPENPLTARVVVNRLWQHHFGRGSVPTPSDFGERGEPPTHPELLDWLAWHFVRTADAGPSTIAPTSREHGPSSIVHRPSSGMGWSLKALHRLIVTSNTYRQSSIRSLAALEADPDNRLFSRMNRRRLEGEAVRDAALAASGLLDLTMGGPGLELASGRKPPQAPAERNRRSIYLFVRRNVRVPFLEAFDAPDTNQSCARRETSTTAPQALAMLNGEEIRRAARAMADRVAREVGKDDRQRIVRAYRLALGRWPTPAELEIVAGFLRGNTGAAAEGPGTPEPGALVDLCLALLNVNEFIYVD